MLLMEDLLTVKEVAQKLHLHPDTVKKYLNQGELEGIMIGNRWRVRPSSLERFLNNKTKSETGKK